MPLRHFRFSAALLRFVGFHFSPIFMILRRPPAIATFFAAFRHTTLSLRVMTTYHTHSVREKQNIRVDTLADYFHAITCRATLLSACLLRHADWLFADSAIAWLPMLLPFLLTFSYAAPPCCRAAFLRCCYYLIRHTCHAMIARYLRYVTAAMLLLLICRYADT